MTRGHGGTETLTVTHIRTAVTHLGVALNHSEEATLHVARVRDLSVDIFAYYRQAFGDSGAVAVGSAAEAVEGVSGLADSVLGLLEEARGAIRDYAAMIAPLLRLTDSGKIRSTPSGEELLETPQRIRSMRAMSNTLVRNIDDVSTLIHDGYDVSNGLMGILDRPDPSGYVTATRAHGPGAHNTPVASGAAGPAGPAGDPVLTAAMSVAVVVKAVEVAATWVWERITRWS